MIGWKRIGKAERLRRIHEKSTKKYRTKRWARKASQHTPLSVSLDSQIQDEKPPATKESASLPPAFKTKNKGQPAYQKKMIAKETAKYSTEYQQAQ